MAATHKDKTFFTAEDAEDAEENPRLSKYGAFIEFQLPGFWLNQETSQPTLFLIRSPFAHSAKLRAGWASGRTD